MNEPIGITPAELWQIILAICGGIVTVAAAIGVIVNAIAKAREPEHTQDQEIQKLKQDVSDIKAEIGRHNELFSKDKAHLDRLDSGFNVTAQALIAILGHDISGNNEKELKDAQKALNDYLIEGKTK